MCTTYSFKELFIKYATPLVQQLMALVIAYGRVPISTTLERPSQVVIGGFWIDSDGNMWFFNGTDDLPAGDSRPDNLEDGDLWVDVSASNSPTKIVAGSDDPVVTEANTNIRYEESEEITDDEALDYLNNL